MSLRRERVVPTRRGATPTLTRFVLLKSGEAYAGFADHSLLVLNPQAAAFAILEPDGVNTRGVCSCAISAVQPRLRLAMHVRNTLSTTSPANRGTW